MLGSPSYCGYRENTSSSRRHNADNSTDSRLDDEPFAGGRQWLGRGPVCRVLIPTQKKTPPTQCNDYTDDIGLTSLADTDNDRIHNALLEELCADFGVTDSTDIDFLTFDLPNDRPLPNGRLPDDLEGLDVAVNFASSGISTGNNCMNNNNSGAVQRTGPLCTQKPEPNRCTAAVTSRIDIPESVASPTISSSCEEPRVLCEVATDSSVAVHSTTNCRSVKSESSTVSCVDDNVTDTDKLTGSHRDVGSNRAAGELKREAVRDDYQDRSQSADTENSSAASSPRPVVKRPRIIQSGGDLLEDVKQSFSYVSGVNMFAPRPANYSAFQMTSAANPNVQSAYSGMTNGGGRTYWSQPAACQDTCSSGNVMQMSNNCVNPNNTQLLRNNVMWAGQNSSGTAPTRPSDPVVGQRMASSAGCMPHNGDRYQQNNEALMGGMSSCNIPPLQPQGCSSAQQSDVPNQYQPAAYCNLAGEYQSAVHQCYPPSSPSRNVQSEYTQQMTCRPAGQQFRENCYSRYSNICQQQQPTYLCGQTSSSDGSDQQNPVDNCRGIPLTPSRKLLVDQCPTTPSLRSDPSVRRTATLGAVYPASGRYVNTNNRDCITPCSAPPLPVGQSVLDQESRRLAAPAFQYQTMSTGPSDLNDVNKGCWQQTKRCDQPDRTRSYPVQDCQPQSSASASAADRGCRGFVQHLIGEGSGPYRSHPLFPLLRDLVIADNNFDVPSFPYPLLAGLPRNFDRLVTNYFSCNTRAASAGPIDPAIDNIVIDALRYAHSALIDKIRRRRLKEGHQADLTCPVDDVSAQFTHIGRPQHPSAATAAEPVWSSSCPNPSPLTPISDRLSSFPPAPSSSFSSGLPASPPRCWQPTSPRHYTVLAPRTSGHTVPGLTPDFTGRTPHCQSDYTGMSPFEFTGDLVNGMEKTNKSKVLPNEAKAIMTEWLREHQDNPYPNDDEKEALMLSTKLTINQINYWFTNARRRLLPKWAMLRRHAQDRDNVAANTAAAS